MIVRELLEEVSWILRQKTRLGPWIPANDSRTTRPESPAYHLGSSECSQRCSCSSHGTPPSPPASKSGQLLARPAQLFTTQHTIYASRSDGKLGAKYAGWILLIWKRAI